MQFHAQKCLFPLIPFSSVEGFARAAVVNERSILLIPKLKKLGARHSVATLPVLQITCRGAHPN